MKIKKPDYKNSILNVSASILKYYGVKTKIKGIKEVNKTLKSNYKHIVLLVLDGLGTNIIKQHLDEGTAFSKHMVKEITSVFPPTTVAATNAVLSGLPPISTGWIGWVQYFKKEDASNVVFLNQDYYNEERKFEFNISGKYLTYESILDKIKFTREDVQVSEVFPPFREGGFDSFEKQVDKLIEFTQKDEKTFTYCYWIEPDLTEHMYGASSPQTKEMVIGLNQSFEKLINEIGNNSIIILIADHGLVDIEEIDITKYLDVMECLERLPTFEPRAATFHLKTEKKKEFEKLFNEHFGQWFQLVTKKEMKKLLGKGEPHKLIDDFIGDFVAIAIDKYALRAKLGEPFKGHHAGLTEGEMMVPLIIYKSNKS
jgi:hypothetical protein